jgi:hypothetical protein
VLWRLVAATQPSVTGCEVLPSSSQPGRCVSIVCRGSFSRGPESVLITWLKVGPCLRVSCVLCAVCCVLCARICVWYLSYLHISMICFMNFAVSLNTSSNIYAVCIAITLMRFTYCIKKMTVYYIVTPVLQTSGTLLMTKQRYVYAYIRNNFNP